MEISGKITVLKETQTIGASGFRKRDVVITTNEQYPQSLLIEFVLDKCDLLNSFAINDEVTISINLKGKGWQAPTGEVKYFNSIQGWKISIKNIPPPVESMIDAEKVLNQINDIKNEEEDKDDFPF